MFVFVKLGNLFREQSTDELFETRLRNIERSQLEQRTLWQAAVAEFHYRGFGGLFIILSDLQKLRHTLSNPLRLLKRLLSRNGELLAQRAAPRMSCVCLIDDRTARQTPGSNIKKKHPGVAADP